MKRDGPLRRGRTENICGGFLRSRRFPLRSFAALWPHRLASTAWRLLAWPCQTSRHPRSRPSPWCLFWPRCAFKIAAVPFHQWTPGRLRRGSPNAAFGRVSFRLGLEKQQALPWPYVCWSVVSTAFDAQWKVLFTVLAILSMTLWQCGGAGSNFDEARMLALQLDRGQPASLIDRVSWTEEGFAAMVLYLAAYLFMNLGASPASSCSRALTAVIASPTIAWSVSEDRSITLGLSLCLLSLVASAIAGFLRQDLPLFAGWLIINSALRRRSDTSVVRIYYYNFRDQDGWCVKEPQESL